MAINYDTYVQDTIDEMAKANDEQRTADFETEVNAAVDESEEGYSTRWIDRLPRNMGMGLFRAALNTIETVDEAAAEAPGNKEMLQIAGFEDEPPLRAMFPGLFEAAHNFADGVEATNSTADDITQGISQFAIPFTGYLKALGGLKGASASMQIGRLAVAEGTTAASAFEAHEGRFADLVNVGRQMDNDFGALLTKLSPDDSMANAYIDYMTNREDEGNWEGRFKNSVDSLVATAGVAGFLKAIGTSLRVGKQVLTQAGRVTPGTLRAQQGMVAFHGSPHNFDEFSTRAIGTGEGAQAFGHGLYFAESPGVAKSYQAALSPGRGSEPQDIAARIFDSLQEQGKSVSESKRLTVKELEARKQRAMSAEGGDFEFFKRMDDAIDSVNDGSFRGNFYEVDIPDKVTNKMLDWDAPLSEQPESVRKAISGIVKDTRVDESMTGGEFYKFVTGEGTSSASLSSELNEAGIPGIRYKAGQLSGGKGDTSNVVLFNSQNIKSVKRNGETVFTKEGK